MAAPAVPGEKPGTSVDPASINTSPISSLHVADPSPREVTTHVGQVNKPDPYVYQHMIQLSQFSWNTTQVPGTLLYSVPIHWSRYNYAIQQICSIYNCHTSDADFGIKVAGTGFHAGALTFWRCPPNIDPTTITNPTAFSMFEWELMDPKHLGMEGYAVMDQRPVMYHYNPLNLSNPDSFGGYFCASVSLPLATSATGQQSISIGIWNKLNEKATFSQPRPAVVDGPITTYNAYEEILPNWPTHLANCTGLGVTHLEVNPTTSVLINWLHTFQTRLDGSPFPGSYPFVPNNLAHYSPAGPSFVDPRWNKFARWPGDAGVYGVIASASHISRPEGNRSTAVELSTTPALPNNAATAIPDTQMTGYVYSVRARPAPNGVFAQNLLGGESPLYFICDPAAINYPASDKGAWAVDSSCNTEYMIRILTRLAEFNDFGENDALLFILIFRENNLPIGYVKLNFDGLLTMKTPTTRVLFRAADYRLSFYSVVTRTSVIPSATTDMLRNQAMLRTLQAGKEVAQSNMLHHRRMIELERQVNELSAQVSIDRV